MKLIIEFDEKMMRDVELTKQVIQKNIEMIYAVELIAGHVKFEFEK